MTRLTSLPEICQKRMVISVKSYLVICPFIILNFYYSNSRKDDFNTTESLHLIRKQSDSIIKWSTDYRLSFDDFQGIPPEKTNGLLDTMAICAYKINYKLQVIERKLNVDIYATFSRKSSWMRERNVVFLKHEQGHFDIAEIYALRLKRSINTSRSSDPHTLLMLLDSGYIQATENCDLEQKKYDIWTQNTLGRDYYYKWIKEQLDSMRTTK
jgi:hypothetical protein